MDRKHFLKGSEAREQALLQRNLETQTRLEVTPFINTQTGASSRIVLSESCPAFALFLNNGVCTGFSPCYLVTSVRLLPTEGGSLTGYEISDMPHPPSLSQSPHLHSLPRSIHKKYQLETTACPDRKNGENTPVSLTQASLACLCSL